MRVRVEGRVCGDTKLDNVVLSVEWKLSCYRVYSTHIDSTRELI